MAEHTPGPWGYLLGMPIIRAEHHTIAAMIEMGGDDETMLADARLISAAPDLLAACELGDVLGADGPALLEYAAAVIERVSANTAWELRRKAKAERAAIAKAREEVTP